jgi:hypothetical protein
MQDIDKDIMKKKKDVYLDLIHNIYLIFITIIIIIKPGYQYS